MEDDADPAPGHVRGDVVGGSDGLLHCTFQYTAGLVDDQVVCPAVCCPGRVQLCLGQQASRHLPGSGAIKGLEHLWVEPYDIVGPYLHLVALGLDRLNLKVRVLPSKSLYRSSFSPRYLYGMTILINRFTTAQILVSVARPFTPVMAAMVYIVATTSFPSFHALPVIHHSRPGLYIHL